MFGVVFGLMFGALICLIFGVILGTSFSNVPYLGNFFGQHVCVCVVGTGAAAHGRTHSLRRILIKKTERPITGKCKEPYSIDGMLL